MARYRFVSFDLRAGTAYAELPLRLGKVEWRLNGAGAWSASLPLLDRRVRAVNWRQALDPTRTWIGMYRNDVLVFGGIVWDTNFHDDSDQLELQGEDLFSYFNHRYMHRDYVFTQWDSLAMVDNLVSTAQSEVTGGSIGVTSVYTPSGVLKDRTYRQTEGHLFGQLVIDLAGDLNGYDFRMSVSTSSLGVIQKQLLLGYPQLGQPAATTPYALTFPGNVRTFGWPRQGSQMATRTLEISDQGLVSWATASDRIAAGYPALDRLTNRQGISVQATLDGYAQADLLLYKYPITIPPIQCSSDFIFTQNMQPGDAVKVSIDHPVYFPNARVSPDGIDHRLNAVAFRLASIKLDCETEVCELTVSPLDVLTVREQLAAGKSVEEAVGELVAAPP